MNGRARPQRLVPVLAVIAAALLVVVLGIEVAAFANERPVPITWPALLAVAIALVGLAVAALVAALVPGRDPLGLSERGRTVYVYAAEALLALLFLHIRVTMPWLFSGWFLRFWPLVVMAIAFVGVGLGEFFQRRRQSVLSEPLTTTGALLPLLPALGFWVMSSEVHYSLLLLSIGVLYAALSVLRKSFWFAVLAALAANGSLWYLLHEREGLSIAEHPQLWLIPPALCVLVAGYINRERLSAEQSAALRYGSAIVIYVSSTADIFINGVADAPWLPAVLAGLVDPRRVRRDSAARAGVSVPRRDVPHGGADDDHLARRDRAAADVDPVGGRHRDRRVDHRAVRRVREAPRRCASRRRPTQAMGSLSRRAVGTAR